MWSKDFCNVFFPCRASISLGTLAEIIQVFCILPVSAKGGVPLVALYIALKAETKRTRNKFCYSGLQQISDVPIPQSIGCRFPELRMQPDLWARARMLGNSKEAVLFDQVRPQDVMQGAGGGRVGGWVGGAGGGKWGWDKGIASSYLRKKHEDVVGWWQQNLEMQQLDLFFGNDYPLISIDVILMSLTSCTPFWKLELELTLEVALKDSM